jgi:hypothetical protein
VRQVCRAFIRRSAQAGVLLDPYFQSSSKADGVVRGFDFPFFRRAAYLLHVVTGNGCKRCQVTFGSHAGVTLVTGIASAFAYFRERHRPRRRSGRPCQAVALN